MAIALVSRVQGGDVGSGSSIASPAQAHTTGNLLVALVNWNDTTGTWGSMSNDTAGNVWNTLEAGSGTASTRFSKKIFYVMNCAGHATNVVTANFSAGTFHRAIVVYEFSGVALTAALADTDAGTGTSTTASTPSLSVIGTNASAVIIGWITQSSTGSTITAGSGYTLTQFAITGDVTPFFADEYKIVTANEAPSATIGASVEWGMYAAGFVVATTTSALKSMMLQAGG